MPPNQTLRELASIPYVGMDYTEAEIIRLRRHLLAVGKMYVAQYPNIPLVYASKAARKKATRKRKKLAKGS